VVIIVVDLRAWNHSRKFNAIGDRLVTQLALVAGVPRDDLQVNPYQPDRTQQFVYIAVFATTSQQASALYAAAQDDNSGADVAQSNGVVSASLVSANSKDAQDARAANTSSTTANVALIVGVIVGCVLLALVLGVVLVIAIFMAVKYVGAKKAPYPATTDSMAELNASNIMYSRNSL
jgi:hypothetical protein